MAKFKALLFLLLPVLPVAAQQPRKTIVAVFPHSDDETAIAPDKTNKAWFRQLLISTTPKNGFF